MASVEGVHEGVHKVNSQASAQSEESGRQGLPPQHHAGQVGYGPNYNPNPTILEKISGIKEEFEGKIKHDPELVRHGHGIRSGEGKLKKLTAEDEPNPFHSATDDNSSSPSRDIPVHENVKAQAATVAPAGTKDVGIQSGGELVTGGDNRK